jgi:DNA repair protein RadC
LCYEGRLAEVRLTNEFIDKEFEEITKREEEVVKEKLKTKWARLEALAGTESRLKRIAQDIVHYFNNREVEGKAMVVCMSRRVAVKMYELLKQIPNAPETAVVITRPDDLGLPGTTKQDREENKKQEYFVCISLNGAGEVVENRIITVGLVNHSLVHPREVFADVITDRAASVILLHNHPSGTLAPSKQDILMTTQLVEAGAISGIKVLDRLIVSKKGHLSYIIRLRLRGDFHLPRHGWYEPVFIVTYFVPISRSHSTSSIAPLLQV